MSDEPPRARVMESVRLPNTRSWKYGAGPRFLLRWIRRQDEEISRRLATEKRRTKRKTESALASRGSDNAIDSLVAHSRFALFH